MLFGVVAVVTIGQWDPHRCSNTATVSSTQGTSELAGSVVVVAVVTLGQWDPHRCNRSATVSYRPGTAELAGTAEQPH
jgi:hypothetical protein